MRVDEVMEIRLWPPIPGHKACFGGAHNDGTQNDGLGWPRMAKTMCFGDGGSAVL